MEKIKVDIIQAINHALQIRPIGIEPYAQINLKNETTHSQEEKLQETIFSKEELEKKVAEINDSILSFNAQFSFKVHEVTGRTVVGLIDTQTHEVVKEIPPEKMMDVVVELWDLTGIIVDRKE
ncbi:flagellar protein FlaG [Carnobacterium sp. TMP28]|uniref:flagellar protein FlaG n=1 Tax=Carnobacterium sp. TMP28 TaxID=3397060 RepID=UPI0039DFB373